MRDDTDEELIMVAGNRLSDMGLCGNEREEAMQADQQKKLRAQIAALKSEPFSFSTEGERSSNSVFPFHVRKPPKTSTKDGTPA